MLDVLIGEWSIDARFPDAPPSDLRGRAAFEWMSGDRFLIQRWEVPVPEAPDGVAIIGFDEGRQTLLQHYFDSRGVARVYEMTLEGGVWTLSRTAPDFSPLSFSQRFTGTFSDDGMRIDGRWEKTGDTGEWEHDFDLVYTRRG
jgi:Protein of unknown function (DUF1579)